MDRKGLKLHSQALRLEGPGLQRLIKDSSGLCLNLNTWSNMEAQTVQKFRTSNEAEMFTNIDRQEKRLIWPNKGTNQKMPEVIQSIAHRMKKKTVCLLVGKLQEHNIWYQTTSELVDDHEPESTISTCTCCGPYSSHENEIIVALNQYIPTTASVRFSSLWIQLYSNPNQFNTVQFPNKATKQLGLAACNINGSHWQCCSAGTLK